MFAVFALFCSIALLFELSLSDILQFRCQSSRHPTPLFTFLSHLAQRCLTVSHAPWLSRNQKSVSPPTALEATSWKCSVNRFAFFPSQSLHYSTLFINTSDSHPFPFPHPRMRPLIRAFLHYIASFPSHPVLCYCVRYSTLTSALLSLFIPYISNMYFHSLIAPMIFNIRTSYAFFMLLHLTPSVDYSKLTV